MKSKVNPYLLIIKTGQKVSSIPDSKGDFEQWIGDRIDLPDDAFKVVKVFQGESLPELNMLSGIIITGSAVMVTDQLDWSEATCDYLKKAVSTNLPVLGICYGHQLLAHALGGEVGYNPQGREIGTTQISLSDAGKLDPLFNNLPAQFDVNVSHSQSVITLPRSATILASNPWEKYHAIRYAKSVWGVQFHPEFDQCTMEAYITHRQKDLLTEGVDVKNTLKNIKQTYIAEKILQNFGKLTLKHLVLT